MYSHSHRPVFVPTLPYCLHLTTSTTLHCTALHHQDLKAHQKSKEAEFARTKASVFKRLSIVELSIFILLGLWDKLADHYVDYSGTYYSSVAGFCCFSFCFASPPII